jgi:membrane-associated phospholipid phosphatase
LYQGEGEREDKRERVTNRNVKNRNVKILLVLFVSIGASLLLDSFFYSHFRVEDIYEHDWGRALRVLGFVPVWLIAALALYLHDRPVRWRAALLVAGVAVSGIVGELLKLVFRRERPNAHDGDYFFRSFADRPLHSGGLALPSTHAIVAFGAAAMLSRLFPRARIVFWGIAWGCGLSRVAAGAHFFSDIAVAAVVAWLVTGLLLRLSNRDKILLESSR